MNPEIKEATEVMETMFGALDQSAFMRQQQVIVLSSQFLSAMLTHHGDLYDEELACQHAVSLANRLLDTVK